MAVGSTMHDKLTGAIIAYPTSVPLGGWPILTTGPNWAANLAMIQRLIDMPEVDKSRVFVLGFSSGGFYAYALACAIGDQLAATVVNSALKWVCRAALPLLCCCAARCRRLALTAGFLVPQIRAAELPVPRRRGADERGVHALRGSSGQYHLCVSPLLLAARSLPCLSVALAVL